MDTIDQRLMLEIQTRLRDTPPAAWILDMVNYYYKTGGYRPSDLRRLLGDPNKVVVVPGNLEVGNS